MAVKPNLRINIQPVSGFPLIREGSRRVLFSFSKSFFVDRLFKTYTTSILVDSPKKKRLSRRLSVYPFTLKFPYPINYGNFAFQLLNALHVFSDSSQFYLNISFNDTRPKDFISIHKRLSCHIQCYLT